MLSSRPEYRRSLVAVCAAVTLLMIALQHVALYWPTAEYAARDYLIRYGRDSQTREDLVFLALDNATVTLSEVWPGDEESAFLRTVRHSGWPWPRDVYPIIIDRLVEAGAKVVALDLVFPTPREGDGRFRRAIERHKDRVVIGSSFESTEVAGGGDQRAGMDVYQPPAPTLILPGSEIESNSGYVTVWEDLDSVVRRVHYRRSGFAAAGLGEREGGEVHSSLAARILEKAGAGDRIPKGTNGELIRWVSRWEDNSRPAARRNFVPHSLYRIFIDDLWQKNYANGAFFKDKIVLIGPYGQWSKDIIQKTPVGPVPGPLFHLNAVNAALNGDFVRESPRWLNILLTVLCGFAAWVFSTRVENPVHRLGCFLGASAAYWGAAQLAYNYFPGQGLLLLLLSPLAALNVSGVVWFTVEQIVEQRERRRVRGILERYVSRNIVKEIVDNPQSFLNQLGGARMECVMLFTDLRGFTSRTEQGDSHQLVLQLNEYFAEMAEIVFDLNGTFDKCIGDAVMAVWGNIRSDSPKKDVENATLAALRMIESVKKLNKGWEERGWAPFQLGAGINQGEVISGIMGSEQKQEVTVIGDAVNLASRLESATKEYGVDILIGETAGALAADSFYLLRVDLVQLVGKSRPIQVYTALGSKQTALSAEMQEFMEFHERGIDAYRNANFLEAHGLFSHCEEIQPESKLTKLYLRRCEMFSSNPPEPGWDGVYVMTKK